MHPLFLPVQQKNGVTSAVLGPCVGSDPEHLLRHRHVNFGGGVSSDYPSPIPYQLGSITSVCQPSAGTVGLMIANPPQPLVKLHSWD
jgi:hypothetical protein